MKYKLIEGSLNDMNNIKETILNNRGIQDVNKYLNLEDDCLHNYKLLKNIDIAVECLLKHINKNSNIFIVVDSDVDGNTSAAIIYQYIKLLNPEVNLEYSIHKGKKHGLSNDIVIPDDTNLVIIPDAGTNDVEQCKELKEKGIDVIILDHHLCDIENPYSIIVNNQMCEYPNKQISGVGVAYKFLQALDDETWNNYADNFLDLVALGLIGDVMDIRECETRRLIDKGLINIENKFLQALITKQSFSIGDEITIINVAFYIVPLINSLIRVGSYQDNLLMFQAFIQEDEYFKYKKRGETEEIDEIIYDRVARLCVNTKNKQNRVRDKAIIEISKRIEENKLHENKVIFSNATNIVDANMTGVVAINIADKYNKPCILLRKWDDDVYGGSGRNNISAITSFKDILEQTEMFDYVQGHDNAFGVKIKKDNIKGTVELINQKLMDIDFSHCYLVDFIINNYDLTVEMFNEFDYLKFFYGQGIQETLLTIKNVCICKEDVNILGKNEDTWEFTQDEEIKFIKFKCKEDDFILNWVNDFWSENQMISMNIIGKPKLSNYNGQLTPQIIVEDYEIN